MAFARQRLRRIAVGVVGITVASLLLGFLLFAAIATRTMPDESRRADAIVVLTGGSARIGEAARLLRNGRGRHLLISGVNRKTSKSDIRRLANLDRSLFDCCVTLGYGALNTWGNAVETRDWQKQHSFKSLIIVTATYHMPRSLAELSRQMPKVKLIPHPVIPKRFKSKPWWLHPTSARILAQEYIKFLPSAAKFALARALGVQSHSALASRSNNAGTRP